MGYPGKVKFPIISNRFAKCDHKGELSAVFSAIYHLKSKCHGQGQRSSVVIHVGVSHRVTIFYQSRHIMTS